MTNSLIQARSVRMLVLLGALGLAGCQGPARRSQALDVFNQVDMPLPTSAWGRKYEPGNLKEVDLAFQPRASTNTSTASGQGQPNPDDPAHDPRYEVRRLYLSYKAAMESEGTKTKARAIRDQIVEKMMTHIAHYHEGQADDVFEISAGLETFFDLAALAFGSTAAVTGTEVAKSALGAAAAGMIGTKSALSRNVLADQTKFAILDHMSAIRFRKAASITTKLKAHDADAYSLEAAVRDLYEYFNAGSLKEAVTELAKAAQVSKQLAAAEVAAADARLAETGPQFANEKVGRVLAQADTIAIKARAAAEDSAATAEAKALRKGIADKADVLANTVRADRGKISALESAMVDVQVARSDVALARNAVEEARTASPLVQSKIAEAEQKLATKDAELRTATGRVEVARRAFNEYMSLVSGIDAQLAALKQQLP